MRQPENPAIRLSEMTATEALINAPEFTVSELSSALKRTVEDAYGHVRVRGEITGFRGPHSSGHCYFALKDDGAKIEAVIWKFAHARMRFKPEEGLEVVAEGRLRTSPRPLATISSLLTPHGARRCRRAPGAARTAEG